MHRLCGKEPVEVHDQLVLDVLLLLPGAHLEIIQVRQAGEQVPDLVVLQSVDLVLRVIRVSQFRGLDSRDEIVPPDSQVTPFKGSGFIAAGLDLEF